MKVDYYVPPVPYFKKLNILTGAIDYRVPDKPKKIKIIDDECSNFGGEIRDFIVEKNLFEIKFELLKDELSAVNLYDLESICFKDFYMEFNFKKHSLKIFYASIVDIKGFSKGDDKYKLHDFKRWNR